MMTRKFRKKPVVIEAVQYNGKNGLKLLSWAGMVEMEEDFLGEFVEIHTLEGVMKCSKGDWLIKGVQGEFYPIKDDIFKQTYEAVE